MRRVSLILIAMACVAAAPAASRWTPKQAACPLKQAPAGLSAEVVKPMLPGAAEDAEISDQAAEQLANLALTCAKQTKVGKARLQSAVATGESVVKKVGITEPVDFVQARQQRRGVLSPENQAVDHAGVQRNP